tara:strand:+ start:2448 stop:3038 length:591 start_codon:yes stop_codon:yes gene_type:complete
MWEFFNAISTHKITPNECLFLFCIKERITSKYLNGHESIHLITKGFLEMRDDTIHLTLTGENVVKHLNVMYTKKMKLSNIEIMGYGFKDMVSKYRKLFPAKKLPSGKLARNNVKTLVENFRWFFSTYDHTWNDVIKATKMYVDEYSKTEFQYMKTSQYFISKQDKHKIKVSELADYCDMVKEGLENEDDFFKEKVV